MYREVQQDFIHAKAGVTVGRICSIIDLGMQYSERFDKTSHQIFIEFEIEELHEGKPLVIGSFFTTKFTKKSNLYKLIQACFAKAIPQAAQASFDFKLLLGRAVQITIESKEGSEATYSKITDYAYVRDPSTVAEVVRPYVYFDLDEPNWQVYHGLSTWMKDRINVPEKLRNYIQPSNFPENREPAQQPPAQPDYATKDEIPHDPTIPF